VYESRAYDNPHGDPVVVLVVTGTHDVSRLVNMTTGFVPTIEQSEAGQKILRQVRRHSGGRAALALLAAHGGPDFRVEGGHDWYATYQEAAAVHDQLLTDLLEILPGDHADMLDAEATVRTETERLRQELAETRAVLAKVPSARCPYHGDQHSRACQYCESRIRVKTALTRGEQP
jgi:hypothetical protein